MNTSKNSAWQATATAWRILTSNWASFLISAVVLSALHVLLLYQFSPVAFLYWLSYQIKIGFPPFIALTWMAGYFPLLAVIFAFGWIQISLSPLNRRVGIGDILRTSHRYPGRLAAFVLHALVLMAVFAITALLVYYACVLLLRIVYSEVVFTDFRLIVRLTGIPLRIYFLFPFFITLPLIAKFIFVLPGYAFGHETALSVARHQVSGLRLRLATAVFVAIAPVIAISSLVVPMTMQLHVLTGVSQRPIFAALAFFWALLGFAGVAMAIGAVTHFYRTQNSAKFE